MSSGKKAMLVEGAVGKMLFRMAVPMVFGMLGIVVFNLADTFFVAQLGTPELAALSFTFPVVLVVGSIAMGLGVGVSAVISRAIGKGDHNRVQRLTTDSLVLALLIVVVAVILGIFTINPLFTQLGATPEIIALIRQYMTIWYLGAVFVIVPMVGNNAIRATGDTKTPGMIMVVAAAINIVLDPILIFGLGPFPMLGLKGAAIATVIARATTLIVALWVLIYRDKMVSFELPSYKTLLASWSPVLYIGLPAAGTKIIFPFAIGVVTRLLASYGPSAVAAFGVATRIEFFALIAVIALSTVVGPFVGQNWAANLYDRLELGMKYSTRFSMLWGVVLFVFLVVLARPLALLFSDDPGVVSTIVLYLWLVPISYGLQGVFQISTTALNVFHRPMHSAALTVVQMFVLYIPLTYIGSSLFGLKGIFAAIVAAYAFSGILSYLVLRRVMAGEKRRYQALNAGI
ncbi:multidrug export protein MepA [archaeon BMS3Abin16]|nr:multidrug export protein MepA [archaeon BMS3Abin16]